MAYTCADRAALSIRSRMALSTAIRPYPQPYGPIQSLRSVAMWPACVLCLVACGFWPSGHVAVERCHLRRTFAVLFTAHPDCISPWTMADGRWSILLRRSHRNSLHPPLAKIRQRPGPPQLSQQRRPPFHPSGVSLPSLHDIRDLWLIWALTDGPCSDGP